MTDRIAELGSSAGQPFRDDLLQLYRVMQPSTVACINVSDPSCLPLGEFMGSSRVWIVDWEPGRPEQAVARQLLQSNAAGEVTCLVTADGARGRHLCGSYLPMMARCANFQTTSGSPSQCRNYTPGRELRVAIGDGSLGRAASFVARIEELIALADTPAEALDRALEECRRVEKVDHSVAIATGSIELVISVLPPSRRVDGPFERFKTRLDLRFGPGLDTKRLRALATLRTELFVHLMDAHARELYRLVDKHVGGLYFATHPVDPTDDGVWSIGVGIPLAFEILGRYFALDFESFPAEAFLRRQAHGKDVVQAALLRPLAVPAVGVRPLPGACS